MSTDGLLSAAQWSKLDTWCRKHRARVEACTSLAQVRDLMRAERTEHTLKDGTEGAGVGGVQENHVAELLKIMRITLGAKP